MASPLHSRTPRPLLLLLVVLSLALGGEARAARRIVFTGISGVGGGEATRLVSRFLTGRFEVVGAGRYAQEARRRGLSPGTAAGRSMGARAVKAVAVVSGSVASAGGQYVVRLSVFSASNGQPVANLSYPMRSMRMDLLTARRVATGIIPAVARARPGPPVTAVAAAPARQPRRVARPNPPPVAVRPPPRRSQRGSEFDDGSDPEEGDDSGAVDGDETEIEEPSPPPPRRRARPPVAPGQPPRVAQTEGDSLGFDVADGDGGDGASADGAAADRHTEPDDGAPARRRKGGEASPAIKKPGGRAEYEKIIEAWVGLKLINRSFTFNEPADKVRPPSNYSSQEKLFPAIYVDAGLYPFAFFGHNALASLGLVASYYRVPVLRSKVEGVETDTTLHELELGLRYRWNILGKASSPTLRAGLSFGRLGFVIHYTAQSPYTSLLPNIVYLYLKFALLQLEVPFYRYRKFSVGGLVSFDYLHVFTAGDIERPDASGYGESTTGGIDFGGGVYVTLSGFTLKVTGYYRRMFYSFDQSCAGTGCNLAGGALDIYQGMTLLLGYAF